MRSEITINEAMLEEDEKMLFALRSLYSRQGYSLYRMSKFEEYDLYARNKDYLVSDNVITFTDTNGRLLALKPDVTLSIIKNSKDDPDGNLKVFYNENVYRVSKGTGSFKEIMQAGLECIGKVEEDEVCEVIGLAAESLKMISPASVINISDLAFIERLVDSLGLSGEDSKKIYALVSEKNMHGLDNLLREHNSPEDIAALLRKLIENSGSVKEMLGSVNEFLSQITKRWPDMEFFSKRFAALLKRLSGLECADMINVDLSVAADINYYNGIVFNGLIKGVPGNVISGGQYDRLMKRMGRKASAIGFAVYMDVLDRMDYNDISAESAESAEDEFLNVALPKGRLGEKVYELFAQAGFECPELLEPGRKLIFENKEKKVRYFWVKPSDVAIYVERGAADAGVCGKDILAEYEPDVYELLDMNMGKCRMTVAAPVDFEDDVNKTLRVATKFSNTAVKYYQSKGRDIDIIHLNGSIEIAPILGLSDVIVDIVETGTTLKENNLEVKEEIAPISARLIVNRSSYEFKGAVIRELCEKLNSII